MMKKQRWQKLFLTLLVGFSSLTVAQETPSSAPSSDTVELQPKAPEPTTPAPAPTPAPSPSTSTTTPAPEEAPPSSESSGALTAPSGGAGEFSAESREYHLKAAFLRYVAKFVDWPSGAIPVDKINICIIGQVPYFRAINSIDGKVVNDRAIVVSKILEPDAAKGTCQILFVAKTEQDNISNIITSLNSLPILSFGDMDNFAQKGGNMNFYIANNRLAIMINPPTVEKANLKISPRMLKVVTVVPNVDSQKTVTQ